MGKKIKQKDLIYRENKYKYDYKQYETTSSFVESTYTGKIATDEAEEDQSNLLKNIVEFNEKSKPRTEEGRDKKEIFMKAHILFMNDKN